MLVPQGYQKKQDCPYATTRTLNPNKWKPRSTQNHHRPIRELFLITQILVSSKTRTATPKPNSSFSRVRTHCRKSRCMNRSLEINKINWTWRHVPNTFELVWPPIVDELDERILVIPQQKAWSARKHRRKKNWKSLKTLEAGGCAVPYVGSPPSRKCQQPQRKRSSGQPHFVHKARNWHKRIVLNTS